MPNRTVVVATVVLALTIGACSSGSSSSSSGSSTTTAASAADGTTKTTIVSKATNCASVAVPAGWEQSELPFENGTRLQWQNPTNPVNIIVLTVGNDRGWDAGNGQVDVSSYIQGTTKLTNDAPGEYQYVSPAVEDTTGVGAFFINSLTKKNCSGQWVGLVAEYPNNDLASAEAIIKAFSDSYQGR